MEKIYPTIHPRIELASPREIRVSFSEEEIDKTKAYFKARASSPPIPNLGYSDLMQLLALIKKQISDSGLTEENLYEAATTQGILNQLKLIPELKKLFSLPQPIWEGTTTEEHVFSVAKTLVAFAANDTIAWLWEMAGLLHDIGKTAAAYFEKSAKIGRANQNYYSRNIAQTTLRAFGFGEADIAYILTLISYNHLVYQFVSGEMMFEEIDDELRRLVCELRQIGCQTSHKELLQDLKTFWLADAAEYSTIQCFLEGRPISPSFCDQFVFTLILDNNQWRLYDIQPKASWLKKYEQFVEYIAANI